MTVFKKSMARSSSGLCLGFFGAGDFFGLGSVGDGAFDIGRDITWVLTGALK